MLKLIWFFLSILLIFLIFIRVPRNQGLTSLASKTNIFGSPNSTERILNNITSILIILYLVIAIKLN